MSDTMDKGTGRGRGRYTAAGVQAQQATDIEALKAAFAQHIADHEAAESEETTEGTNQ